MTGQRLFAAIRPPGRVLAHLDMALAGLRDGLGAGLRWSPTEQHHLTLAFYPQVPTAAVDEVIEHLSAVAADQQPLRLRLNGAGSFGGRVLWIGVGGDTGALAGLMAAAAADPHALEQHQRRPHLTVARPGRRSRGVPVPDLVRTLAVYSGPSWPAESVELVSSRLGAGRGGGALHTTVATLPLGG